MPLQVAAEVLSVGPLLFPGDHTEDAIPQQAHLTAATVGGATATLHRRQLALIAQ
jgi:hypothetical protein